MAFNINNFLNEESRKEIKSDWKPVRVSARKLRPASDKVNFYHTWDKEIRELAESIELIGLQQYPVIRPIKGTDEYEVIAGHKRRLAVLRLLDEGKTEFEMIPCKIETPDDIRNELILIFTNSTQRERTDYEKMQEIKRVRKLLEEYQETHELTGRKQSIIAEILGTNKTKIGTLDNISSNLAEPFREAFAAGSISTNTANEIAGLEPDVQQALYETYKATGTLTAKDVKAVKEPSNLPKEANNIPERDKGQEAARNELQDSFAKGQETEVQEEENMPLLGQQDISDYPEYVPEPREKGLGFTEWIQKKYGMAQYTLIGKEVRAVIASGLEANKDKPLCPAEWEDILTNVISAWVMKKTKEYQEYLQS